MSNDYEQSHLFTRRAVLLGGIKAILLSTLMGRLYYLQIIQGHRYHTLAEENRIHLRLLAPPRGQITDRHGTPLAVNQQNYRIVLQPKEIISRERLEELLDDLSPFIDIPDIERRKIIRDRTARRQTSILLHDNITWDQVAAVSLHTHDFPGVEIEMGEARNYPYGDVTAHVIGYVGSVTETTDKDDSDEENRELSIPGFRVGKNGVEKQYDSELRGKAGTVQMEVNAHGQIVRELDRTTPRNGEDLNLSLDIALQQMVAKRLAQETVASAMVMNTTTGEVLASVSSPSFDANLFSYGISRDDWQKLNTDERTPMLNKVVGGTYAPGSTFKVVTALAGLEAGVLDPDATVFCPGHYDLGDHRFHCWKRGGHGNVNLHDAMAMSCDTFFYDLGSRVGIEKIQAMAQRLGLGEKSGIDLPHERSGLIPGRAWKFARGGGAWQKGETVIAAIGQGYILTTPAQLTAMMACIANGGKLLTPRLAKGAADEDDVQETGINRRHLAIVRECLTAVVNSSSGTANAARMTGELASAGMAGKTGTSQVRRISMSERSEGVTANDDLPWKERDHALFIGFAPIASPRYAVTVVVEHGGSGAHIAAPIARDILAECLKRNI